MTNTLDEDRAVDPALAKLLSQYPDAKAPPGWEKKVLAAFDDAPPRRSRTFLYVVTGLFAAAAIVVAMLFVFRHVGSTESIEVAVQSPQGTRSTGTTATIRDWLVIKVPDDAHTVRIYHDGILFMGCPGEKGCNGSTITTPRLSAGVITIVVFHGTALPSTKHLTEDLEDAADQHIKTDIRPAVYVH